MAQKKPSNGSPTGKKPAPAKKTPDNKKKTAPKPVLRVD